MTNPRTDALVPPWGTHQVPEGETLTLTLGPLTIWARRQADEFWLNHVPGDPDRPPTGAPGPVPPEDSPWTRWPVSEGITRLVLVPGFPDRPLVVEPELSFRMIRGARARIYVRVPLHVRVRLPGGELLQEVASLQLSDTWWGDFEEGEVCYWLPTTARRAVSPEIHEAHLAICPLQLSNESEDDLSVEKLALRVAHLSLFQDEGRLWADETRVRYRGEAEGSDIDMSGQAPREAEGARLVSPPQDPAARSFRARSFARLRSLPGLGAAF